MIATSEMVLALLLIGFPVTWVVAVAGMAAIVEDRAHGRC